MTLSVTPVDNFDTITLIYMGSDVMCTIHVNTGVVMVSIVNKVRLLTGFVFFRLAFLLTLAI